MLRNKYCYTSVKQQLTTTDELFVFDILACKSCTSPIEEENSFYIANKYPLLVAKKELNYF